MGHQHHRSKRKTVQQAINALQNQIKTHKEIAIRCEPEHFDTLVPLLSHLGLRPNLDYYDNSLVFRWNGSHYEPYKRDYFNKPYESGKITLNWNYVQTENENL